MSGRPVCTWFCNEEVLGSSIIVVSEEYMLWNAIPALERCSGSLKGDMLELFRLFLSKDDLRMC